MSGGGSLSTRRPFIVAIDGPAASGKGTLGKHLAAHYGLRHLDTGLIYRAVAKAIEPTRLTGYPIHEFSRRFPNFQRRVHVERV